MPQGGVTSYRPRTGIRPSQPYGRATSSIGQGGIIRGLEGNFRVQIYMSDTWEKMATGFEEAGEELNRDLTRGMALAASAELLENIRSRLEGAKHPESFTGNLAESFSRKITPVRGQPGWSVTVGQYRSITAPSNIGRAVRKYGYAMEYGQPPLPKDMVSPGMKRRITSWAIERGKVSKQWAKEQPTITKRRPVRGEFRGAYELYEVKGAKRLATPPTVNHIIGHIIEEGTPAFQFLAQSTNKTWRWLDKQAPRQLMTWAITASRRLS